MSGRVEPGGLLAGGGTDDQFYHTPDRENKYQGGDQGNQDIGHGAAFGEVILVLSATLHAEKTGQDALHHLEQRWWAVVL